MKQAGQRKLIEDPMEEGVYSSYEISLKKEEIGQQPEKQKERSIRNVVIFSVVICLLTVIALISAMCTVEDELIESDIAKKRELTAMAVVARTTAKEEPTVTTESMETTVSTVESTLPETVVTDKTVTEPVIEEIPQIPTAVLSAYGPSETYYYDVSYEDKVLMAKMVYSESGTEPFEGKVAIAAVILNRFFYGEGMGFDRESIESVLLQKNQFADISKVTMQDLEKIPDCMEAVEAACKGWDPTREAFPETGALYFYAPKLIKGHEKEIREGINYMSIGNVNFHVDFQKN